MDIGIEEEGGRDGGKEREKVGREKGEKGCKEERERMKKREDNIVCMSVCVRIATHTRT